MVKTCEVGTGIFCLRESVGMGRFGYSIPDVQGYLVAMDFGR